MNGVVLNRFILCRSFNCMNRSKSKTVNILDKIDTGISRENLQKISNILNDDLADEYVTFNKDKKLPLEC